MYHNEAVRKFEHLMSWEVDHARKARSTHKPTPVRICPAARVFTDKSFIGYANEVKAVLLYNELESAWGRSLPHNKEATLGRLLWRSEVLVASSRPVPRRVRELMPFLRSTTRSIAFEVCLALDEKN